MGKGLDFVPCLGRGDYIWRNSFCLSRAKRYPLFCTTGYPFRGCSHFEQNRCYSFHGTDCLLRWINFPVNMERHKRKGIFLDFCLHRAIWTDGARYYSWCRIIYLPIINDFKKSILLIICNK